MRYVDTQDIRYKSPPQMGALEDGARSAGTNTLAPIRAGASPAISTGGSHILGGLDLGAGFPADRIARLVDAAGTRAAEGPAIEIDVQAYPAPTVAQHLRRREDGDNGLAGFDW